MLGVKKSMTIGGGFKRCLVFTPKFGEMIQFDEYVSNGVKPPNRLKKRQLFLGNPDCFCQTTSSSASGLVFRVISAGSRQGVSDKKDQTSHPQVFLNFVSTSLHPQKCSNVGFFKKMLGNTVKYGKKKINK